MLCCFASMLWNSHLLFASLLGLQQSLLRGWKDKVQKTRGLAVPESHVHRPIDQHQRTRIRRFTAAKTEGTLVHRYSYSKHIHTPTQHLYTRYPHTHKPNTYTTNSHN